MSDEPTTATATATAEPPAERTVPYDRFKAVNDKLAEANRRAEEAAQRAQELEDRDKSELEQARSKIEKLEAKNAELSGEVETLGGKLVNNERSAWVKDAAAQAKFIDPTDALGRVDLSSIEDRDAAKKAVAEVAKEAKHLIAAEGPTPPQIGRVLENGQPVQPTQPQDPNAPSPEDVAFLAELKAASSAGWSSSGARLLED